jgi:hypothetical protein
MSKLSNRIFLFAVLLYFAKVNVAIGGVPAVHYGADWRPFDVRSCTIKALEAMRDQNFIEITRTPTSAWGVNEQSFVLVRCIRQNLGVFIEVFAASWSNQEAERLRNQIRISVFDARIPDKNVLYPDHIDSDSGVFGGQPRRQRNYPSVHWGYDSRPKSLQGCISGAKLAMHKNGLQSTPNGNILWGTSSNVVVLVSCTPIDRGVSILVIAASDDGATAERFRNDVRKITFDSVLFD